MADGKKILIVEDDTYTRELYEEVLKEEGFEVTSAVDGEEGLVKAKQGGFHLILLDLMMPKLDGIGFLKGLKDSNPEKVNGKVVLLTNLAHDPVIKEGMSLGANAYLIKSDLNPEELVKKVRNFL